MLYGYKYIPIHASSYAISIRVIPSSSSSTTTPSSDSLDYSYYCWLSNITISNTVQDHEVYRCSLTMLQDGIFKLFVYIGHLSEVRRHPPFYSHVIKKEWIQDGLNETQKELATYLPNEGIFVLRLRREFKVEKVSMQCKSMSVNISFYLIDNTYFIRQ